MFSREQFAGFDNLLSAIFATHPPVKVTGITAGGDVRFRVMFKSMKLEPKAFTDNYALLCTNYVANLLGEWLVRSNFDAFAELRTPEDMKNSARAFNHKNFGMFYNKGGLYLDFVFHVSLLDRIDEEFRQAKAKSSPPAGAAAPAKTAAGPGKAADDPLARNYDPHEIFNQLTRCVIGQDRAARTLAARGALHFQKARLIRKDKPVTAPNECLLFIGPSGCGKTYLAEQFGKLCRLPFASFSATDITETGYVGLDVEDSLAGLINAAGGCYSEARTGVLFIDEIDKKATREIGTIRDISGTSVQQCFLRMMEGCECLVGQKRKGITETQPVLNTYGIQFIFGGAFSELDDVVRKMLKSQAGIGFGPADSQAGLTPDRYMVDALVEYGMIPEWVNRLTGIVVLNRLAVNDLFRIITAPGGPLESYRGLLSAGGMDFILSSDAAWSIARYAYETGTMARGLKMVLGRLIEDIVFEGKKGTVKFGPAEVNAALGLIDGSVESAEKVLVNAQAEKEGVVPAEAAKII